MFSAMINAIGDRTNRPSRLQEQRDNQHDDGQDLVVLEAPKEEPSGDDISTTSHAVSELSSLERSLSHASIASDEERKDSGARSDCSDTNSFLSSSGHPWQYHQCGTFMCTRTSIT